MSDRIEEWRSVKDYEQLYSVSNLGNVKRNKGPYCRSDRPMTPQLRCGYHCVILSRNDTPKHYLVHRLVAQAFLGDPLATRNTVNHIDGNKLNNVWSNLEYASVSEQHSHDRRMGKRRFQNRQRKADALPHTVHSIRPDCYKKLCARKVMTIRALYANRIFNQGELANIYEVSVGAINDIIRMRSWKWV